MSCDLTAAKAEKEAAIRAHDDLIAAQVHHPHPWRASKARNLVDADGMIVARPGLPKRQVAAMAREANARAAVALSESTERLHRSTQAVIDLSPPVPGVAGVITVDGQDYVVEVPNLLRVSVADFAAGLATAGLPCQVAGGKIAIAPTPSTPFVHVHHVNPAAYRALSMAGWDFTFIRLFGEAFLGTVAQGLPRDDA